jgi:hypothetical protein
LQYHIEDETATADTLYATVNNIGLLYLALYRTRCTGHAACGRGERGREHAQERQERAGPTFSGNKKKVITYKP